MIYGITYADERMSQSAELCKQSMLKNGIDNTTDYYPPSLSDEFKEFNRQIFDGKRGAGCYWLFKPYLINKRMSEVEDGSMIIYSDAGIEWIAGVHNIIDRMDQDIFFFTNGFPHVEWCKMDVYYSILGRSCYADEPSEKQVQASVIFIKVNQSTRNFIKEWLLYCQMPGFIDDSPSKLPNYPTFAEHRHDQAILTCLQIKYGYKLHFWPTPYSEHIRYTAQPEDNYPSLFNHHRKRNTGMGDGDPEW